MNSCHSHGPEDNHIEICSLERTMKRECEENYVNYGGGVKKVFLECSKNASQNARNNVPYKRVQSILHKRRRKNQPKNPKNPSEYVDGLISTPETYGKYYLSNYKIDGRIAGVLFGHPDLIEFLRRVRELLFDSTFRVVTRPLFYQVMTIHIIIHGKAIAALIIAMSGKSLDHYIAALSEVKVLIPEFDPIIGIADFEIAQRLGAQEIFLHLLGKN